MMINSETLDLAFKGFKTVYTDAYLEAPSHKDKIAMTVASTGRDETHGWMGMFPNMREWVGPRHIKSLAAHGFTIKNRKFEATVDVTRDNISDDRLGLVDKPARHLEALAQENPPMPTKTPTPWSTVIARLLEILGLPKDATEEKVLEALDAFADPSAQSASASETPDPRRFVPIEALHDLMAERGTREATMREADAKAKV